MSAHTCVLVLEVGSELFVNVWRVERKEEGEKVKRVRAVWPRGEGGGVRGSRARREKCNGKAVRKMESRMGKGGNVTVLVTQKTVLAVQSKMMV